MTDVAFLLSRVKDQSNEIYTIMLNTLPIVLLHSTSDKIGSIRKKHEDLFVKVNSLVNVINRGGLVWFGIQVNKVQEK